MRDSLAPPGTIEVTCSYPGCGLTWWIPKNEPVPDNPDCGSDHHVDQLARRHFSMLHLRFGVSAGTIMPRGPQRQSTNPCDMPSMAAGLAGVADRERGQRGVLEWASVEDLAPPEKALKAIRWGQEHWNEALGEMAGVPDEPPPGHVRWVGYKIGERVRRYTFTKCVREGCPHTVMVDVEKPDYQPTGYMVGSWGGGTMPEPKWFKDRKFRCEDGLSTTAPNPCVLVRSDAIAQYEQSTGARWTCWYSVTDTCGSILFYDERLPNRYGLFLYDDASAFSTAGRIAQGIQWGSLADAERLLRRIRGNERDDLLFELQIHTERAS